MPYNPKIHFIPPLPPKREKRVGIYCRVSSNSAEQLKSLTAQVSALTRLTAAIPQWLLSDIYIDIASSKTGSSRKEFARMLEDCQSNNLDIILTKSISRFGRDTVDTLEALNQLKTLRVRVIFEQESLDTANTDSDLMISIIESVAQAENESRSDNIRWGIKQRAAQGTSKLYNRKCYGYTNDVDGNLIIDGTEAKNVQLIFDLYLQGESILGIIAELERLEIKSPTGKDKWSKRTIDVMLSNEKYIGDALLQKTYTVDFLTKKRVVNNGIVPQYYVENSHEAIIPREIFMQVQEELVRRSRGHISTSGKKRNFSANHVFSQIIFCGECGEIYRRVHWNNRGKKSIVWRCISRLENTGLACHSRTVQEDMIGLATVDAINKLLGQKDDFLITLKENIETVISETDNNLVYEIDKRLEELQKDLLRLANSKEDYNDIADEIYRLRDERHKVLAEEAGKKGSKQRLEEMVDFLNEQPTLLEEYDEQLVKKLIEKITVYDDKLTIEFKSGVEIDIEI